MFFLSPVFLTCKKEGSSKNQASWFLFVNILRPQGIGLVVNEHISLVQRLHMVADTKMLQLRISFN